MAPDTLDMASSMVGKGRITMSESKYIYVATYEGAGDQLEIGGILLLAGVAAEVSADHQKILGKRDDVVVEKIEREKAKDDVPAPAVDAAVAAAQEAGTSDLGNQIDPTTGRVMQKGGDE